MIGVDDAASSSLRAELAELVTAVWFEIDHGDPAAVSGFFTVDAQLTFGARTFRGAAEIDGVYRDRASRGSRTSRHLASNLHVLDAGPARVRALSALVLHAQDGAPPFAVTTPVLVADVHDLFVPATGPGAGGLRWRIADRRIVNLFLQPGDVLAVPTQ